MCTNIDKHFSGLEIHVSTVEIIPAVVCGEKDMEQILIYINNRKIHGANNTFCKKEFPLEQNNL